MLVFFFFFFLRRVCWTTLLRWKQRRRVYLNAFIASYIFSLSSLVVMNKLNSAPGTAARAGLMSPNTGGSVLNVFFLGRVSIISLQFAL